MVLIAFQKGQLFYIQQESDERVWCLVSNLWFRLRFSHQTLRNHETLKPHSPDSHSMYKSRPSVEISSHNFRDERRRLPLCCVEGCCWAGNNLLAITKKCFEVGGCVERWQGKAGGYRFWGSCCGYHNPILGHISLRAWPLNHWQRVQL